MPILNYINVSEQPDSQIIDWESLKNNRVDGIIIKLSEGNEKDPDAQGYIDKANSLKIRWHGYHTYVGVSGEGSFSARNAKELGLKGYQHLFLDIPKASDDLIVNFYTIISEWQANGFNVGLRCFNDLYLQNFNNDDLTNAGVYRWIIGSSEPKQYDMWEYNSQNGYNYDRSKGLTYAVHDTFEPLNIKNGARVGIGIDTSGLGGGPSLGYSTDGKNFYAAITPLGFVFRKVDAERMWRLLKSNVSAAIQAQSSSSGLQMISPNGTIYYLVVDDNGNLSTSKGMI